MNATKLLIGLFLIPVITLLSCNKDFDLSGDHVETPVIYCLLDKSDSLHYLKITRTFGGSNNSLEVAQIADSSYFQDVDIVLEEWGTIGQSAQKIRQWTLRDTIITNKNNGAFYSPNQKVYYFATNKGNSTEPTLTDANPMTPLKNNCTYKLKVNINNGAIEVTGSTELVSSVGILAPAIAGNFTFVKEVNGEKQYQTASIKVNNGNAKVLDVRMEIFIREYFNGNPVDKSFVWKIGDALDDAIQGTSTNFNVNGNSFYQTLKTNLTNDASITKRELMKIRIYSTGGSEDLAKYIQMTKPSTSLAQNKVTKVYGLTRPDGGPLLGIFSSRMTVFQEKLKYNPLLPNQRALDKNSMIELCTGPITGSSLFCSDNIIDNTESWYCQ
jgi:hypothetical protein